MSTEKDRQKLQFQLKIQEKSTLCVDLNNYFSQLVSYATFSGNYEDVNTTILSSFSESKRL